MDKSKLYDLSAELSGVKASVTALWAAGETLSNEVVMDALFAIQEHIERIRVDIINLE